MGISLSIKDKKFTLKEENSQAFQMMEDRSWREDHSQLWMEVLFLRSSSRLPGIHF